MTTLLSKELRVGRTGDTSAKVYIYTLEVIENSVSQITRKANITINLKVRGVNSTWKYSNWTDENAEANITTIKSGSTSYPYTQFVKSITGATDTIVWTHTDDYDYNDNGTLVINASIRYGWRVPEVAVTYLPVESVINGSCDATPIQVDPIVNLQLESSVVKGKVYLQLSDKVVKAEKVYVQLSDKIVECSEKG